MSSRHGVDRQQSIVTGANYVDGIPVKIGEKYKPPHRITLPLSYSERNPSEVLSEDYNFNLERQVIAWSEKHRKAKEQNAKAQVDKVAYQIEQFTRINHVPSEGSSDESPSSSVDKPLAEPVDSPHDGGDASASGTASQPTNTNFHVALLANLENRDILKPVPLKAPSTVCDQSSYQFSSGRPHNNIKLEDFEAESSPFDSVELKTLNDMEELKSVLQGMVPQQRVDAQPLALPSGSATDISELINSPRPEVGPLLNGTIEYYPGGSHINGAVMPCSSLSSSYPAPSSYNELPSIMKKSQRPFPDFSASQPFLPDNSIPCQSFHTTTTSPTAYTNSVSQYSSYVSSTHRNPDWNVPDKSTVTSFGQADKVEYTNTQVASLREYTYASLYHPADFSTVGSQNQAMTPSSDSSSGSSNSSLRNARSTPDLLKELGRPVKEEIRERKRQLHSHPPRPNSVGSVEEAANSTSLSKHRPPLPVNVFETFNQLDEEGKRLVHQMMDMGFPRPRSALAVKKLGLDDKKIVEHLCAVQALAEKGFDPDQAAVALHLHDQDEVAAQIYLQLMKQFLDLGFDETSIAKALALHKNDRDKALDYLVS